MKAYSFISSLLFFHWKSHFDMQRRDNKEEIKKKSTKRKAADATFLFGAPDRGRTCTSKIPDPKSGASANSATGAIAN